MVKFDQELEQSLGIAWAQSCLEGVAKNENIPHESGKYAEKLLKECGWRLIDTRFTGHGYKGHGMKPYQGKSEVYIYESNDKRFQAKFCYYKISIPCCLCGFRKVG